MDVDILNRHIKCDKPECPIHFSLERLAHNPWKPGNTGQENERETNSLLLTDKPTSLSEYISQVSSI